MKYLDNAISYFEMMRNSFEFDEIEKDFISIALVALVEKQKRDENKPLKDMQLSMRLHKPVFVKFANGDGCWGVVENRSQPKSGKQVLVVKIIETGFTYLAHNNANLKIYDYEVM